MGRTDRASQVIAAPPEQVYTALVDPDALTAWLPPGDMTGEIERFDPQPGGAFRMALTFPDGPVSRGKSTAGSDIFEARFTDLVPGRRVSYAVRFVSDEPGYASEMTMAWNLIPIAEGTRVDITADNVPDLINPEDHAAGMTASLTQLAEYLQNLPA